LFLFDSLQRGFYNFFANLPPIKIWKIPKIKKCFPTVTRRTTSGQSNLTGARAEERFFVTSKSSDNMPGVIFLFNYYTAKSKKKVRGCPARNATFGTTRYALVQKTRGNSFVADSTDQNCTTK
jgi:hypothetical protein